MLNQIWTFNKTTYNHILLILEGPLVIYDFVFNTINGKIQHIFKKKIPQLQAAQRKTPVLVSLVLKVSFMWLMITDLGAMMGLYVYCNFLERIVVMKSLSTTFSEHWQGSSARLRTFK